MPATPLCDTEPFPQTPSGLATGEVEFMLWREMCRIKGKEAVSGFQDTSDAATQANPIIVPADTWTSIPCDGQGFVQQSNLGSGITRLWNPDTNQLDLNDLTVGSIVSVRVDFNLTPSIDNCQPEIRLNFPGQFTLPKRLALLNKGAGIEYPLIETLTFYIGDAVVRDVDFQLLVSNQCELVVNGYFINVTGA